jgi:hypothetical protein
LKSISVVNEPTLLQGNLWWLTKDPSYRVLGFFWEMIDGVGELGWGLHNGGQLVVFVAIVVRNVRIRFVIRA